MASRPPFLDSRLERSCVYCGRIPGTKDHVPPKVFLDEPYPSTNLPVVKACNKCNNRTSRDEEYVASLVECVLSGSTDPEHVSRESIRKTLNKNALLRREIEAGRSEALDGSLLWDFEKDRVRNVIVKLARGHVAYELSEPKLEEPQSVWVAPLTTLTERRLAEFECGPGESLEGWPEIGSRAFQRVFSTDNNQLFVQRWITVQLGRYRYAVHWAGAGVHLVISEYLAAVVRWDEN